MDILFGPALAVQLQPVAETCREQGVRLVLPFFSGQPLEDYPLVYNATAPSTYLYDSALKKLMSFYPDMSYVIVHSGDFTHFGTDDECLKFLNWFIELPYKHKIFVVGTVQIERLPHRNLQARTCIGKHIKLVIVCISSHECIHVCQAILDYYGEDNWDGEIPAYLDGYLFRQIVYAIGVPCRQTLGIE